VHAQQLPSILIREVRTAKTIPFPQTIQKGKINLICFWGTWCAHGKHQVKTIAQNLPSWQKRFPIHFIAIATDEQTTEHLLLPYLRKQNWIFPIYLDPNSQLKQALHVTEALPYIMVIDKNGKVFYTHTGYMEASALSYQIKEIAKEKYQ
jgi:thioredoxin-related protein